MVRKADFLRKGIDVKGRWSGSEKHGLEHKGFYHPEGRFLRPAIFGMNDGIVSLLALAAGLVGASMGKEVVIVAGLAEMFAGAISMSIGTYISTKSQLEFYNMEVMREKRDLERMPAVEKEHVREIYRKRGFKGKELDIVVNRLTSNKKIWLDVLIEEELGLSKGDGARPVASSVVMFFAFLCGAFIPLSVFFFIPLEFALKTAVVSGLMLLFFVGAGKTYFTGKNWFRSGFEMVFVGSLATWASFYIGGFISGYLGLFV